MLVTKTVILAAQGQYGPFEDGRVIPYIEVVDPDGGGVFRATAVQSVPLAPGADEHVAGSVAGLGAAEVPRRELTEDEAAAIVRAEIAERTAAADQYGRSPAADRLRSEAALLGRFLD